MKKIIIIAGVVLVLAGGIFGVKSVLSLFNSFVEKQQAHQKAVYEQTQERAEDWYNRAIETIDGKRTENAEFYEEQRKEGEEKAKWREENTKRILEEAAKIEAEKETVRQSWANQNAR